MGDSTKERILEIARDLFVEQGADAVSMRAVARAAGLTAMAIYRHFDNRSALMRAVVQKGADVFMGYLQQSLAEATPWARLACAGRQYYRFAVEQPRDYAVMFMRPAIDGDMVSTGPQAWQSAATFRFLVDRVRECMDAGVLSEGDAEQTALTIWAQVHGLVSLYLAGKLGLEEDEFKSLYARSMGQWIQGVAGTGAPMDAAAALAA